MPRGPSTSEPTSRAAVHVLVNSLLELEDRGTGATTTATSATSRPTGLPRFDRCRVPHGATTELPIRSREIARLDGVPTPVDLRPSVICPGRVVRDTEIRRQIMQRPVGSFMVWGIQCRRHAYNDSRQVEEPPNGSSPTYQNVISW